jgi:hypothetical protein
VLHEAVGEALGALREEAEALGGLPRFLLREVYRQRRCGLLEFGYVVVKCARCGEASEVPFSCKSRLCPSCSARRAHETAVHLVHSVLPHVPFRQWTVSFPYALRWRLVKEPGLLEELLRKTTRLIAAWQRRCARKLGAQGRLLTGAVTQVQSWGSALQLSPHFHTLAPDGLFAATEAGVDFVALPPPTPEEVATLVTQLARRVTKVLRQRGLEDAEARVDDGLDALRLESLQHSLALGTARPRVEAEVRPHHRRVAVAEGISLHADTAVHANDSKAEGRLARYAARGPLAASRLSLARGRKAFVPNEADGARARRVGDDALAAAEEVGGGDASARQAPGALPRDVRPRRQTPKRGGGVRAATASTGPGGAAVRAAPHPCALRATAPPATEAGLGHLAAQDVRL